MYSSVFLFELTILLSVISLFTIAIDCGILNPLINGDVKLAGGSLFLSNATYSCDQGFNLMGVGTRTCLSNGEWSGSEPECIGKPWNTYY